MGIAVLNENSSSLWRKPAVGGFHWDTDERLLMGSIVAAFEAGPIGAVQRDAAGSGCEVGRVRRWTRKVRVSN